MWSSLYDKVSIHIDELKVTDNDHHKEDLENSLFTERYKNLSVNLTNIGRRINHDTIFGRFDNFIKDIQDVQYFLFIQNLVIYRTEVTLGLAVCDKQASEIIEKINHISSLLDKLITNEFHTGAEILKAFTYVKEVCRNIDSLRGVDQFTVPHYSSLRLKPNLISNCFALFINNTISNEFDSYFSHCMNSVDSISNQLKEKVSIVIEENHVARMQSDFAPLVSLLSEIGLIDGVKETYSEKICYMVQNEIKRVSQLLSSAKEDPPLNTMHKELFDIAINSLITTYEDRKPMVAKYFGFEYANNLLKLLDNRCKEGFINILQNFLSRVNVFAEDILTCDAGPCTSEVSGKAKDATNSLKDKHFVEGNDFSNSRLKDFLLDEIAHLISTYKTYISFIAKNITVTSDDQYVNQLCSNDDSLFRIIQDILSTYLKVQQLYFSDSFPDALQLQVNSCNDFLRKLEHTVRVLYSSVKGVDLTSFSSFKSGGIRWVFGFSSKKDGSSLSEHIISLVNSTKYRNSITEQNILFLLNPHILLLPIKITLIEDLFYVLRSAICRVMLLNSVAIIFAVIISVIDVIASELLPYIHLFFDHLLSSENEKEVEVIFFTFSKWHAKVHITQNFMKQPEDALAEHIVQLYDKNIIELPPISNPSMVSAVTTMPFSLFSSIRTFTPLAYLYFFLPPGVLMWIDSATTIPEFCRSLSNDVFSEAKEMLQEKDQNRFYEQSQEFEILASEESTYLSRCLDAISERIHAYYIRPLLINGFESSSSVLTEEIFFSYEVKDPWVQDVISCWGFIFSYLSERVSESNYNNLAQGLLSTFLGQWEELIREKKSFNLLGALQLDNELRQVKNFFSERVSFPSRSLFDRIGAITHLLLSEKNSLLLVDDQLDESVLSFIEQQEILSKRIEFSNMK